jgi:hypothetical protein
MATPPDFTAGAILTAAQMNTVGMWEVSQIDFTGAITATVNNVFTSDFENYRVVINGFTGSVASANWQIVLRAAGSNNTAGYSGGYNFTTFAGVTGAYNDNNAAGWNLSFVSSTGATSSYVIDFIRPQVAASTNIHFQGLGPDSQRSGSGTHSNAGQFDGFQIIAASGTIAGRIRVYGYRN